MLRTEIFRDTNNYYLNGYDNLSDKLVNFAKNHSGKKILDIGCATGDYSKRLTELNFQVVGIDINPDYVDLARKNNIEAYCLDAKHLSDKFPEKSFDTVLLFEVLEHVEDPEKIIEQAKKVARKNILITVPDSTGYYNLKALGLTYEHMLEQDHRSFFTITELENLLKKFSDHVEVIEDEPLPIGGIGLPFWLRYPVSTLYRHNLLRSNVYMRLYAVIDLQ